MEKVATRPGALAVGAVLAALFSIILVHGSLYWGFTPYFEKLQIVDVKVFSASRQIVCGLRNTGPVYLTLAEVRVNGTVVKAEGPVSIRMGPGDQETHVFRYDGPWEGLILIRFRSASGKEYERWVELTPAGPFFNLAFKYGVLARNELDTFKGTFTKDMVLDPPIIVNLLLSREELDRIYMKMIEIDFFDYPGNFSVSTGSGFVTPHSSYYFRVAYDSGIKEIWWDDAIIGEDKKAEKLRELIHLITGVIESKEEYRRLPPPTSGYA